jgi:hypothetical protein
VGTEDVEIVGGGADVMGAVESDVAVEPVAVEEVNKLCLQVGHVLLMRNQCVKLSELNMCPQ